MIGANSDELESATPETSTAPGNMNLLTNPPTEPHNVHEEEQALLPSSDT